MFPLKISSLFGAPLARQPGVAPVRSRSSLPDASEPPAREPAWPEVDRRMRSDRRMQDRREKEQSLFLDTRTGRSRRRSPGRRAQDQGKQNSYQTISIMA